MPLLHLVISPLQIIRFKTITKDYSKSSSFVQIHFVSIDARPLTDLDPSTDLTWRASKTWRGEGDIRSNRIFDDRENSTGLGRLWQRPIDIGGGGRGHIAGIRTCRTWNIIARRPLVKLYPASAHIYNIGDR